jgi:hypothetical protein
MTSNNPSFDSNRKKIQKMMFIYNALENGWMVRKKSDAYIFSKKHENKREVFDINYLDQFLDSVIEKRK